MSRRARVLLILCVNYFLFAILLNSVGTVILELQTHHGVAAARAGALEGFKDLSIACASFFAGGGLLRFGYRRAMLAGLVLVGLGCLAMPSLAGLTAAKILFLLIGVSFALIKVSVFATLGMIARDPRDHAATMNFLEGVFMVGILAGFGLFGAVSATGDWLRVYYLLAGACAAAALLLAFTPIPEPTTRPAEPASMLGGLRDMAALVANHLVMLFVASAFFSVLIEQSIMSWLPTFNRSVLHLPVAVSIAFAGILPATCAIGRFAAAALLKSLPWLLVLLACLAAAAALVLAALPLADRAAPAAVTGWADAPLAALVFPAIGFFLAPIYPAINSAILSALPAEKHGPMAGLITIFSALGGTTGSIINGYLFQIYGGRTAFRLSLIPIITLALCLAAFQRAQSRTVKPVGAPALS